MSLLIQPKTLCSLLNQPNQIVVDIGVSGAASGWFVSFQFSAIREDCLV